MSEALDRLTASIGANQDATASVLALVSVIAGEIRSSANDSDALNALADKLDGENTTIAAAVVANTPAAPGAPGATPPTGTGATPPTGTGATPPAPLPGAAPVDAAGNPVSPPSV